MLRHEKAQLTAADVMSREIVTIGENEDAWSAIRTLLAHGITGAPVIDAEGRIVGVVSQTDLVRYLQVNAAKLADFYSESEPDLRLLADSKVALIRDVMSPRVITADENDSVDTVSRIMLTQKIHRVIITRGRRLVGIVTTMDVLRAMRGQGKNRA